MRLADLTAMLLFAAPPGDVPPHVQPCPTGPISEIFIDNRSIFDVTDPDLDPRLEWAYRLANALHYRTRRSVVRRELLFGVGDCYDEQRLAESERLLRGTDYISRIDIFGLRQDDGSYHVVVDTQDEWSTKVDLRLRLQSGGGLEGIRVRETNLLGTGQTIGVFWEVQRVERLYGAMFHTSQLAGTRWDLRLSIARTLAGTAWEESLRYPFTGEIGRWSALHAFRRNDRLFDFISENPDTGTYAVMVPVRDKGFDLAVLSRLGRPGRSTLLGVGLAYQELAYPGGMDAIRVVHGGRLEDGVPADSATAAILSGQLRAVNTIRTTLLIGQRNVWWVKRHGLDSMRGEQDVQLGAEATLALGRSVPALERDNDLAATLSLNGGLEVGPLILAARARGDGRRDLDASVAQGEWLDLFMEAEALAYLRGRGHTLVGRVASAGGWSTRTPFQLTLGGDRGLRGYALERFPGGRRVVATLEERVFLGWPLPHLLDLGVTAFVDVGRSWPGDVPFGLDSGWRASAGFGLRGSFPPGGRNTYRLDVALPIERGNPLRGVRIALSLQEIIGLIAPPVDPQILRSRHTGLPDGSGAFPH